jgi:xylulokinase
MFHPYLMGERSPYWNPHLRGDFVGISAHHNAHHFARAILEGVAYSIYDCLQVVRTLGQSIDRISLIGGGARSKVWRRVICNVLGIPLSKPKIEDAAFGSALLAGVGIGMFASLTEAVHVCTQREEILLPDAAQHAGYQAYFEVYRDIVGDLAAHSARLTRIAERQTQHDPEESS